MTADELKEATVRYFLKKRMAVHLEVGVNRRGRLRADAVCLSMKGTVTIGEIKSSPRDFKSDNKWGGYLEYCHRFYFVMTRKTFDAVKDSIPAGIGVFVASPRSSVTGAQLIPKLRAVRNARHREMDEGIRQNLIIRMAFRSADRNRFKHVNKDRG